MKHLFSLLVILAVLLGGCAPMPKAASGKRHPVVTMHGDVQFTLEEREAISMAAWKWSLQTNGLASITVLYDLDFSSEANLDSHDRDHVIIRATSDMQVVQEVSDGVLAWVVSRCGGGIKDPCGAPVRMVVVSDRMPESLEQIVIHEFGHVLSMQHVPDSNSIMRPAVHVFEEERVCLKQPDISEFCRVWDCGLTQMFPCD